MGDNFTSSLLRTEVEPSALRTQALSIIEERGQFSSHCQHSKLRKANPDGSDTAQKEVKIPT